VVEAHLILESSIKRWHTACDGSQMSKRLVKKSPHDYIVRSKTRDDTMVVYLLVWLRRLVVC
jgi:hypothetical protein